MGRLTKEPSITYTTGENAMCVAKYTLAVDRKYKREGEQSADFIPCTAFGKAAEFVEKYCHQGTKLVVEGRIQTGSYTNRDGQKVYTTEVMIESQEFAESKNSGGEPTAKPAPKVDADGFMHVPEDLDNEGLPF